MADVNINNQDEKEYRYTETASPSIGADFNATAQREQFLSGGTNTKVTQQREQQAQGPSSPEASGAGQHLQEVVGTQTQAERRWSSTERGDTPSSSTSVLTEQGRVEAKRNADIDPKRAEQLAEDAARKLGAQFPEEAKAILASSYKSGLELMQTWTPQVAEAWSRFAQENPDAAHILAKYGPPGPRDEFGNLLPVNQAGTQSNAEQQSVTGTPEDKADDKTKTEDNAENAQTHKEEEEPKEEEFTIVTADGKVYKVNVSEHPNTADLKQAFMAMGANDLAEQIDRFVSSTEVSREQLVSFFKSLWNSFEIDAIPNFV
jgi:hypothetical protein